VERQNVVNAHHLGNGHHGNGQAEIGKIQSVFHNQDKGSDLSVSCGNLEPFLVSCVKYVKMFTFTCLGEAFSNEK